MRYFSFCHSLVSRRNMRVRRTCGECTFCDCVAQVFHVLLKSSRAKHLISSFVSIYCAFSSIYNWMGKHAFRSDSSSGNNRPNQYLHKKFFFTCEQMSTSFVHSSICTACTDIMYTEWYGSFAACALCCACQRKICSWWYNATLFSRPN